MGARGQRLGEAQIRERLDLVDRWRGSGLSMRVWAQGQGLEVGVLIGVVAYESCWRAKLEARIGSRLTFMSRDRPTPDHERY